MTASAISSFVAFASHDADIELLKNFAASKGLPTDAIQKGMIGEAVEYLKNHPSPDLLLVEIPGREQAPELLDSLAEVCDPATQVITIGKINEYSFYCWLMDIGVTQYLLSPLTETSLDTAFQKLQSEGGADKKEKPTAKIIAVMGARGGVGATTIALNLAGILAEGTRKKVALVDLDPQEGSVSLALDIQPSLGLREVLQKPDRIDSLFLDRVMNKVGKYLSVLSAEESLSEQLVVNDQAAEPLLHELRNKYDYVVLDVPRHMNLFTRTCLQAADYNFLVVDLSLLSLRDTLRMQDAMRDAWKTKPPLVIANRIGLAAKQEVPLVDFEKGANTKIAEKITFAPDLFMPISQDIPAVTHKNHEAAQPLYRVAAMIAPQVKSKTEAKAKSHFSFDFLQRKRKE